MKHSAYLFITFLILSTTTASFAQTGEINGKVVDKKTKAPISFAIVTVELNGNVVAGTQSDADGNYSIRPLTPGQYKVKASLPSNAAMEVKGVLVEVEKFTTVNLEIQSDTLKKDIIVR